MKHYTTENGFALPEELFSEDWGSRRKYASDITSIFILQAILENEPDWCVRAEAFKKIRYNKRMLKRVALNDPDWRLRLLATQRLYRSDDDILVNIAFNDVNEQVRSAAVSIIYERLRLNSEDKQPNGVLLDKMQQYLPKQEKRYRIVVDNTKIIFLASEGTEQFYIIPKSEANYSSDMTGDGWYNIREAILAAETNVKFVELADIPTWGRGHSVYYIRIKPLSGGKTEIVVLVCASGCPQRGCTLHENWKNDPDALIDGCADYFKQYRVILPYEELRKAATEVVLFNDEAIDDLQHELTCQWETEESDAGIRY